MLSIELIRLHAAFLDFEVPIPDHVDQAIADALALQQAAEAAIAEIRAEAEPNIDDVTPKTIRKVIDAHVAVTTKDIRLAAAERILRRATNELDDARRGLVTYAMDGFREPFSAAVAAFRAEYDALDGNLRPGVRVDEEAAAYSRAVEHAGVLARLAELRNRLAIDLPSSGWHSGIETYTRYLSPASIDLAHRLGGLHNSPDLYSASWWARIVATPGLEIEWNTPADQERFRTLPAYMNSSRESDVLAPA